ncbi:phage tail protein [Streptomyces sp. RY43-2]|uniref:Phage tail protein n=1 Tax=Streptomyces macrolidinus TaxID=2952607 RepID=A0ABT0ZBK2_9ACTN|nr:phage tail protein [Streptomyces macrolidinus]MCN9241145.1 phage tail protein [Streptomyces macrolidinus]
MRGTLPGLPTPHPLLRQLPAVYLDQPFVQGFLGALDEVLAPVLLTLDNLPAHLDPRTAPEDLLAWLAEWVAAEVDGERPVERRRAVVAGAVARHRQRGTLAGLAAAIRVETGLEPEISESGATSWSAEPGSALPGAARPWVRVRVRVADAEAVAPARARLERLVAAEVPAQVGYAVEVVAADGAGA